MINHRNSRLPSHADLVVIGGGMCGISTARHAAETGKQVVLLEAATIGSGMSGSTAGHVMTGFLPSPAEMAEMLGPGETLRLQRWSHQSKLALRHRWIEVGLSDAITEGYLLVAANRDETEVLESIAAYCRNELGIVGVRVIRGADLLEYIFSPMVDSALYDPSAFTIDPSLLVEGLKRLAQHPRIAVCEATQVARFSKVDRHYRVETTLGEIVAESVSICTGARAFDLVPELKQAVTPTPTLVAVSSPIPVNILRNALPSGLSGSDCTHHPDYWTVLKDGRFLFGCSAPINTISADTLVDGFRERVARVFPTLSSFFVARPAVALVDGTQTGLPIVGEIAPGLRVATGFSGLGLAAGYGAADVSTGILC